MKRILLMFVVVFAMSCELEQSSEVSIVGSWSEGSTIVEFHSDTVTIFVVNPMNGMIYNYTYDYTIENDLIYRDGELWAKIKSLTSDKLTLSFYDSEGNFDKTFFRN